MQRSLRAACALGLAQPLNSSPHRDNPRYFPIPSPIAAATQDRPALLSAKSPGFAVPPRNGAIATNSPPGNAEDPDCVHQYPALAEELSSTLPAVPASPAPCPVHREHSHCSALHAPPFETPPQRTSNHRLAQTRVLSAPPPLHLPAPSANS